MKAFLIVLVILSVQQNALFAVQPEGGEKNVKQDTLLVKQIWDQLFEKRFLLAIEDSLIHTSIYYSQKSNRQDWVLRIHNFWSQQKIVVNDFSSADSLIDVSLAVGRQFRETIPSVDYRDALFQKAITKFYRLEWDSCIYYAQNLQQLAEVDADTFNLSIAIALEATVYPITRTKSVGEIESMYQYAYELAKVTPSWHDDAMALHNFSSWLSGAPLFDLKRSMEVLLEIQAFAKQKELESYSIYPYQRVPFFYRGTYRLMLLNIGLVYFYLGNFQEAVRYIDDILTYDENLGSVRYASYVLFLKAYFETFQSNSDFVRQIVDKGIKSYQQHLSPNEEPNIRYYYYCSGWLAEQEENFPMAIMYYQRALGQSVFQIGGNDAWDKINENHIGLFRTYIKSGKISKADSLFNYMDTFLDQNLVPFYKLYMLKELPFYYQTKNLEKQALQASLDYYVMKDSLAGISKQTIASSYEKQFQLREKDQQIQLSKIEKERDQTEILLKNKQLYLLILWLMVLSVGFFSVLAGWYLKRRQSKRLAEKNSKIEILIRELHHRVKNNLQIVSGLLYLQRNRVADEEAKVVIGETIGRVEAMAMIHKKLYSEEEVTHIDMQSYCTDLLKFLSESFGWKANQIKTHFQFADTTMDIETAVPLGLIINELMTNAFKHAKAKRSTPEIDFHFTNNMDHFEILVSDNGQWKPQDNGKSDSFGTKLIELLAKQISATIDYRINTENGSGLTVRIKSIKRKSSP